jgi:hypothetical protein
MGYSFLLKHQMDSLRIHNIMVDSFLLLFYYPYLDDHNSYVTDVFSSFSSCILFLRS